jgi:hypothetical protein
VVNRIHRREDREGERREGESTTKREERKCGWGEGVGSVCLVWSNLSCLTFETKEIHPHSNCNQQHSATNDNPNDDRGGVAIVIVSSTAFSWRHGGSTSLDLNEHETSIDGGRTDREHRGGRHSGRALEDRQGKQVKDAHVVNRIHRREDREREGDRGKERERESTTKREAFGKKACIVFSTTFRPPWRHRTRSTAV